MNLTKNILHYQPTQQVAARPRLIEITRMCEFRAVTPLAMLLARFQFNSIQLMPGFMSTPTPLPPIEIRV
jgi:hypothetical protein